jgi:transposase InsO family protein
MLFVIGLWTFLRAWLLGSAALALENLAFRHQLLVLQRSVSRPRLSRWDRIFWVWLSRVWASWRSSLVIVQPATVLAWHRRGFQLYWRWKSRPRTVGRPKLDAEIRHLIRQMARDNPTWGRRRIQAELALLGHDVAELTVAKYMHRTSPRPSPTWRAFLAAHVQDIVAVDFFLVPTLTFRLLFVFVVLRHDRRELIHFSVTDHPTAGWTARQIIEGFPDDTAPKFLLRDRDQIYGEEFARRVKSMGIREVPIAPRAPWQNPFVERVIGSIRRECLDQFLILSEAHLRRLLRAYLAYYNTVRPHQALDQNSPQPRDVQPPSRG